MKAKKLLNRKRVAGAVSIFLAAVLLLGGTFAWRDYQQHKTNEALSNGIVYKARLVEDFDQDDVSDWKITDPQVTKKVSVLNPGPETPDDTANYGDIFVRLQLKEFMEMYPVEYIRTAERYMTDKDGAFIAFATEGEAQAYADAIGNGTHTVAQIQMYKDTTAAWYIQTKAGDPAGVYGDFIVTDISVDRTTPKNMVLNSPPTLAKDDQATEHNDLTFHEGALDGAADADNDECLYTAHTWADGLYDFFVNGAGNQTFFDYIAWILGDDVITYDEWQNNFGGAAVDKWIVDTASTEGWVYWGQPLAPGAQTSNLLEAIDLIKQPSDAFYYAIHVDMQAVCLNELENWTKATPAGNQAPQDIIDMLKASYVKVTGVVVSPNTADVKPGDTQAFTASVRGTSGVDQDVIWSVANADGTTPLSAGTAIADGVLTVDALEAVGTQLVVTATSKANGTVSGKAYLTVIEP